MSAMRSAEPSRFGCLRRVRVDHGGRSRNEGPRRSSSAAESARSSNSPYRAEGAEGAEGLNPSGRNAKPSSGRLADPDDGGRKCYA